MSQYYKKKKNRGGREYGARGSIEELGKHIYSGDAVTAEDKFNKTTEAIASYVGKQLGKPMYDLVMGSDKPPPQPANPDASVKKDSFEMRAWDRQYDQYLKDTKEYTTNKGKVFIILLGQCDLAMKTKLESLGADYTKLNDQADVLGLIKKMRNITLANTENQYEYWSAAIAIKKLSRLYQHNDETLPQFYKRWMDARDVAELQWGPLFPKPPSQTTQVPDAEARAKFQACLFLAGVQERTYKPYLDELCHDFMHGQNHYPKSPEEAMTKLTNRLDSTPKPRQDPEKQKEKEKKSNVSYAQKKYGKKKKANDSSDSEESNNSSITSHSKSSRYSRGSTTTKEKKKNGSWASRS